MRISDFGLSKIMDDSECGAMELTSQGENRPLSRKRPLQDDSEFCAMELTSQGGTDLSTDLSWN